MVTTAGWVLVQLQPVECVPKTSQATYVVPSVEEEADLKAARLPRDSREGATELGLDPGLHFRCRLKVLVEAERASAAKGQTRQL